MRARSIRWLILEGILMTTQLAGTTAAEISLSVDPQIVLNQIDPKIYGHFLEHIYRSANGGLWGELVFDRSFENLSQYLGGAGGHWVAEGNVLRQQSLGIRLCQSFGDPTWTDYEYTLETRQDDGQDCLLIIFRRHDTKRFYWYNTGGWGGLMRAGVKGENYVQRCRSAAVQSVQAERWYRIRVRCEGSHIQIHINDQPTIDFTDIDDPVLAGGVGIGTWGTTASFRNLRVTALDGRVLFEGLPKVPAAKPEPNRWRAYGPGTCQRSKENPLNGAICARIDALAPASAATGIAEGPIQVRKGETYVGSVWVRGKARPGIRVRLLEGEKSLAVCMLPAPIDAAEWMEYPIRLTADSDTPDARLAIELVGAGRVWIDQVSLMAESVRRDGGFRPDLISAVAGLRPPVIRWPGGAYAERYRWKEGIGPQSKRVRSPIVIWDDQDVNSFGTDEFIALCRRLKADPLIVINTGRHDPATPRSKYIRDACQWLEYCNGPIESTWGKVRALNGHPEPYGVKYWEIDNETWPVGASEYCRIVREFVPALKAVDPTIKIAICGCADYDNSPKIGGWNRVVIPECATLADYYSIHHYEDPDQYAEDPRRYEAFLTTIENQIKNSPNPNLKIFVSEWNAQSTDWRTGLYCGGLLNGFERCGTFVGMASPALFLRHISASAWDNAFINFDQKSWFPAPNYVVMKLWHDHYAPERIALEGNAGPLNIVATRTEDGNRVVVKAVNPGGSDVDLALRLRGGFRPLSVRLQLIAPGSVAARNTLDTPDAVRPENVPITIDGPRIRFSLPAYSAGVAMIER
ncbi:MAG: DUF1080 domain-containing protein [bacterium]|nr:DUF1080 domain-containing protein [bacterium]